MRSKLIKLRQSNNMSQSEVAKAIGVARSSYALVESGKRTPSYELAIKISELFGFELDPDGILEGGE